MIVFNKNTRCNIKLLRTVLSKQYGEYLLSFGVHMKRVADPSFSSGLIRNTPE